MGSGADRNRHLANVFQDLSYTGEVNDNYIRSMNFGPFELHNEVITLVRFDNVGHVLVPI